ncbi:RDD family protein [Streptomyces sp. NPDC058451]|uniref:RDD family protein n=1 Tax=Streptomyces sp. NPDC058451 TaxID=3346506 RepID=UPI0036605149
MSAPTPAPGDDRPREGYYPDPSIPGYVRYWNGAAWVPGTSRPAPADGEPLGPPPGAGSAAVPAVEETGPHFFDEDPVAAPRGGGSEPASSWGADRNRQSGFGEQDHRVSWGAPAPADPRLAHTTDPAAHPADTGHPDGTFVFRRPTAGDAVGSPGDAAPGVPGPGAPVDEGTVTFRTVPPRNPAAGAPGVPGQGAPASGVPSGGAGPAGAPAAGGPGFGAGQAAAARAAAAQAPGQAGPRPAAASARTPGQFEPPPGTAAAQEAAQAGSRPGTASAQGAGQAGPWPGAASGGQVPEQAGSQPGAAAAHRPGQAGSQPGAASAQAPGQVGPQLGAAGSEGPAQAGSWPGVASGQAPEQAGPRPGGAAAQGPGGASASASVASAGAASGPPGASGPGVSPMSSGSGGGQSSWAQQVHRLAGSGEQQPGAPWKPPVEDLFQAAARRQAAARPAGLGRRLAARLVDSVVLGGVTAVAAVPLGTKAIDHVNGKIDEAKLSGRTVTVWLLDGTTGTYLAVVLAVLLLVGVVYEVLPTAKWGRTLGKKLCGLEVRDIEGHEPPSFGPALRRWLVWGIPGLLGIGLVGMAWCLFDRPWRQCWHDKVAHTFVAG